MSRLPRRYLLGFYLPIIAFGIALILKSLGLIRDAWDTWGLIFLLLLLGVGLLQYPRIKQASGGIDFHLKGMERAHVRVIYQATGQLVVEGGAAPENLLTGRFETEIEHSDQIVDETANLELRVPQPAGRWGNRGNWHLILNDGLPLTLEIETAAKESRVNLLSTRVSALRLNSIASPLDVTLPAGAGYTVVTLEGGNAMATLHVPAGVAARITGYNSPDFVDVDPRRFPRVDGCWESPEYKTAANRVDIDIKFGAGMVKVR